MLESTKYGSSANVEARNYDSPLSHDFGKNPGASGPPSLYRVLAAVSDGVGKEDRSGFFGDV